ncbi:hypothetical protein B0A52_08584 [Exophiala mesophila]|uniref:Fungal lipase-type domain-containing protein n=1 Tax=Exophiala mesophila TaxID=212818 RepID=A0A438MTW4_EXOME|nr:hypothetical protein B0A52_08584 [Exophiala mesophila]
MPAWQLGAGMGVFGFAWNFAMWIPTFVASGPFLYILGIVDLVIAVSLAVAAGLQGQSIPHAQSACSDFIMANPPNSTAPSLFIVISGKNSTLTKWRSECISTIRVWQFEVAVSVLYMLSALFNIILGSCGTSHGRRSRSSNTTKSKKRADLLKKICYYLLCWPPIFVLWQAPAWSILRGRYAKRFMFKFWRGHRGQDDDLEFDAFDEKKRPQSKSVQALSHLLQHDNIPHANISSVALAHTKRCISCCSKCYYDERLKNPTTYYRRTPCHCYNNGRRRTSYIDNEIFQEGTNKGTIQQICRACNALTPAQFKAKREKKAEEELMFLRGFRRKPIRTLSESALDSGSTIPNASGLAFIDNSQGASAAVVELSSILDDAIEKLDLQGNLRDSVKRQLDILDHEASKYANSGVSEDAQFPYWNPTNHQVELVGIAWRCADNVYSADRPTYLAHGKRILQETHWINPSIGREDQDHDDGGAGSRQAEQFLAHRGFLSAAESLLPLINAQLDQLRYGEEDDEQGHKSDDLHIILTGHSAGGAIASLLYLKILSESERSWPRFTFSCITFGSPPVVSEVGSFTASPSTFPASPQRGLSLSIINEYDLVTRADAPYIRCLAQLLRSIYQLPPLVEQSTDENQPSPQSISFNQNEWPLPLPQYQHVGTLVVLQQTLQHDQLALQALEIQPVDLAKMLFCRIKVHSRKVYNARVESLTSGRFNNLSPTKITDSS